MTRYSYSRVSCYGQCPYKYKLRYLDKLKTIPEQNADNALYLGLGVHKGIEMGNAEDGVDEYKSHYNVIGDANYNWIMQLQYQIPKVLEVLPPDGIHELEIKADGFIGYADYIVGDTLYDFKFSNNVDNYINSPQLSIYKHFIERTNPNIKINHLVYVFVPKVMIRQKLKQKPVAETLVEFRERLMEHLESTEVKLVEVPFNETAVHDFYDCMAYLDSEIVKYPKNPTNLCRWCDYKKYCESNGENCEELVLDF